MTTSQSADLAISSGSQTHIWHAPGQQTNNFTVLKNAGSVNTSRWNQNNKVVVTAGETGQLVLNYINGTVMGVLPQESERKLPVINAVCFSKGSKYLATGCMNGEVFVWNLKRQNIKQVIKAHSNAVTSVHCSPGDKYFASSGSDGSVMLHKVHDETPGTVLPTESQIGKTCVHFSPLDGALASSAEDGSLYVWDTATCQTQDSYNNLHQAAATSVAFLSGSHVLASSGLDEQLLLLDRRSNRVAASASPGSPLHAMACRDDGSTIAVGTAGGTVLLYDPRNMSSAWDQTTCSEQQPIKDLHWQHSASGKLARTVVKEQTSDSQRMRSASDKAATLWPAAIADLGPSHMATPAHAAKVNPAMAVFSPLDTNVLQGLRHSSQATPMTNFANLTKPNTDSSTLWRKSTDTQDTTAAAGKLSEAQQPRKEPDATTPTLTFRTPSLQPQQRTPTLAVPALLQPQSPREVQGSQSLESSRAAQVSTAQLPVSSSQEFAFATPSQPPSAHPTTPSHNTLPHPLTAAAQPQHTQQQHSALGSQQQHVSEVQQQPAAGMQQQAAAETQQQPTSGMQQQPTSGMQQSVWAGAAAASDLPVHGLPGHSAGLQSAQSTPAWQEQQAVLDPARLLQPSESWDMLVAAVQDEMETRLVGLREDFQASQQQLVQQFAQNQSDMLAVVEALAVKQDGVAFKLDRLTDQLQQLLTKQASMMLL